MASQSSLPTSQHFIGPPGDPETAKQFLLQLFRSVNPDPENKRIFSHFTQGTDTEIFKGLFQDVQDHILQSELKDYKLQE